MADGVTAGLRNWLRVLTTDAATSAPIALKDVEEGSLIIVRADGTNAVNGKLASVTISGNAKDGADAGSKVGPITEVITAGFDVQTVTLNTAVDANLTLSNEGGKAVSTLAAGASASGISHAGSGDLATITTRAGKYDITLNAVYSPTAKAASVTTGAGDDKITVNADNNTNDVVGAPLTVSAGDGKDTIVLATAQGTVNAVATNVNAGAGDDTVSIQTVVATTDVIDSGDGTDTAEVAGQTVVDEIELRSPPATLSVSAKAADMVGPFRSPKTRSWDATTLGALVNAIAIEHRYQAKIDPELGALQIPHLDQMAESDMALLTRRSPDLTAFAGGWVGGFLRLAFLLHRGLKNW